MRSISSLLTSSFLLLISLYILKLPGIFISITTSALLNRSKITKTPLVSFYLLDLFSRTASSRRQIDMFWGFVLRPWKKQKLHLSSFLLRKEASLRQQQTAESGSPTGRQALAVTSCLRASRCSKDLIQIWAMDIILLYMQANQFILNKNQFQSSQPNQFPLSNSELQGYQQTIYKLSQQKKKTYLQAIKSHNQQLVNKIKAMDKKLHSEIDTLTKKIVPNRKRSIIPRLEEMETPQLTKKFEELNRLKQQLQAKRVGVDSLQFLLMVKQQQTVVLGNLSKQIAEVKQKILYLERIKAKSQREQNVMKQEIVKIGQINAYGDEISELKKRVHQKRNEVKKKKEEFLSLYSKNRSHKSFVAESLPKETIVEISDPELVELKRQYEQMGRKIDILKVKKSNLLKSVPDPAQQRKILQRLKIKYQSFSKMSK